MDELSTNYATALHGMLDPKQREDALLELEAVCGEIDQNEAFRRLLCSRSVSIKEKQETLEKVYGKQLKTPHLLSFLKVLVAHHRVNRLHDVLSSYRRLIHEDQGVKEGIAYSATKLTPVQLASITEAVAKRLGSKVSLSNVVDHRLLGGVKVAIDGKVFDSSLQAKLNDLQRKLQGGNPA
ncbi:MAG: ATP synthase F1 subunit delta [Bacilli bacterium]|nr:ATP synthase F1 subunit delta [Bacilli bacterium]